MPFKRKDGRRLKSIDPVFGLVPYIMRTRTGAQVLNKREFYSEPIDEYIKQQREKGYEISYMSVVIAALVRTIAQRPQLNRFIINGRIYAHNDIVCALAVKKTLEDDSEELLVKFPFTGTESIYEVNDIINKVIRENKAQLQDNLTTNVARAFMMLPNFLIKGVVGFVMKMDDWNIMPKAILDASPFHASFFLTNMKSIKQEYVYHHLYDFGSCSIFLSMGKVTERVESRRSQLSSRKMFTMGYTVDERICDGFYLTKSFKIFETYVKDPSLLEKKLDRIIEDCE